MAKRAISVTLDADNVTWLKGRAGGTGLRSVSELLDRIVTTARASGSAGTARSVVGTIDIDAADPLLDKADAAVRAMFETSVRRPMIVRERRPKYGSPRRASRKRHG
jgi:hypothetical protein